MTVPLDVAGLAPYHFHSLPMKFAIIMLVAGLCASCSSDHHFSDISPSGWIALPVLAVDHVDWKDGLGEGEVKLLSSFYFKRFVSGCGMPDSPKDCGEFWCVQLWSGYVATDAGKLWFSKDGSRVFLDASKTRLNRAQRVVERVGKDLKN